MALEYKLEIWNVWFLYVDQEKHPKGCAHADEGKVALVKNTPVCHLLLACNR